MDEFFDQSTEYEDEVEDGGGAAERPESGPSCMVNGSYQPLEVGASFIPSVKQLALQAGFGKFRVFLNGTEIKKKSSAPREITENMQVELRPYDEAA